MSYCGYITRLKNVRPHSNAERLLLADCFGNQVIVSTDYTEGQLGVYFPCDGQLCQEFCEVNNLLRKTDENGKNIGGYMDERRRVTAVKLRGEKSDGLFLSLSSLANFTTISDLKEGDTISVLNGVEICKKYIPQSKRGANWHNGVKKHKPRRTIAPTFYEHVETNQLAYYLNDFHVGDTVELTLKVHGTSARTANLPLLQPRTFLDKLLRRTRKKYGYVTGTRRVVLDTTHDGGYYNDNSFRLEMAKKFEGKLRKGETVYYEIVGFVNENTPIMASASNKKISDKAFIKQYGETTVFSYGCDPTGETAPKCEVYVYRMTMVNEDGDVVEYSPDQMRMRCEQMGVNSVPVFERFVIPAQEEVITRDHFEPSFGKPYTEEKKRIYYINPGEYVVRKVEQYYDGPDPIGKTHIREGVVARIVNNDSFRAYKMKNFSFKQLSGIAIEQAEKTGELANVSEDMLEEL